MGNNEHIEILERYFQGKASIQEVRYLLSQLDNTANWDLWAKEKWDCADDKINPRIEEKMFSVIQRGAGNQHKYRLRNILAIAASFLILFLSFTTLYLLKRNSDDQVFKDMVVRADKGQKTTIILPDSTVVWINSDTEIRYGSRFNANERQVELTGEAFFEVAHRENCPFIVTSGDISVTALGTSFNVKAYPDEASISALLVEGQVLVKSPTETIRVSPSQMVTYNRTNRSHTTTTLRDIRLVTAWREDKLMFDDMNLLEITKLLSRQYNISFVFTNDKLKEYEFNGTINNTSLSIILEILSLTSPLSYRIEDNTIILSENEEYKKRFGSIIK